MKGLWAGVSGVIEGRESPLTRAKIEIFEELGIDQSKIKLVKSVGPMSIVSPQYKNHQWKIFPFLFETTTPQNPEIKLNWEHSDYQWISQGELSKYKTVPSLGNVLSTLL